MTAPDIPCVKHLALKAAEDRTCAGQLLSVHKCEAGGCCCKKSIPADLTFKVKHLSCASIRDVILNTESCALGKAVQPPGAEYFPLRQLQG